jgi:hypothetical protein
MDIDKVMDHQKNPLLEGEASIISISDDAPKRKKGVTKK